MTDRISIKELRQNGEFWLRAGDVYTDNVLASHILALIDAVEAAHTFFNELNGHIARGWHEANDLNAALSRFDFDSATRAPANPHPQNTK